MNTPGVLGFMNLGAGELIVVLIIGVLLFGRRLPEMGRYLGKGLVEFKKGLHGLEDDLGVEDRPSLTAPPESIRAPQPLGASRPGAGGSAAVSAQEKSR